jgi:hypothetical protein
MYKKGKKIEHSALSDGQAIVTNAKSLIWHLLKISYL